MTAPNLQGAARRPPPRLLVATSVVVLAVSTVLAVLGAFRTGITTDEPIHVMRLQNFFETGWYALDWDYAGAGPGSDGTNTSVYGPVAMLLLHAWSVLWGVEGWGEVAASPLGAPRCARTHQEKRNADEPAGRRHCSGLAKIKHLQHLRQCRYARPLRYLPRARAQQWSCLRR